MYALHVGGGDAEALERPAAGAKHRIASGGIWSGASWLVANLCGPASIILLVRSMSHRQYGFLVFAVAPISILATIAGFGLNQATVQLLAPAEQPSRSALRPTFTAAMRLAGACALAATSIGVLVGGLLVAFHRAPAAVPTLWLLLPVVATAPLAGVASSVLTTTHRPRLLAGMSFVGSVASLSIVVLLVSLSHPKALWIAGLRSGGALVVAAVLVSVAWRRVRDDSRQTSPGPSTTRLISLGSSLLLGTVSVVLLAQLDVFVLGLTHGSRSVAFYGPASQIADNALGMTAIVGTFYLPTITRATSSRDFKLARELYMWASRWSLFICAPVISVILFCPRQTLTLLFGSDYAPMAWPLRVLGLGVLVHVGFGLNGYTLDSLSRVRLIAGRQVVGLVANVVACAVLVPLYGALGAAIATTASILVVNLTCAAVLYRETGIKPFETRLIAPASGLLAVWAFVELAPVRSLHDLGAIVAVAVLTAAIALAAAVIASTPGERYAIASRLRSFLGLAAPSATVKDNAISRARFRRALRPDDTFLVGHPKSGNTWLAFMIAVMAVGEEHADEVNVKNVGTFVPTIHGQELLVSRLPLSSPRTFRNEWPVLGDLYPRTLYLVRDPRSVLVSYYHHYAAVAPKSAGSMSSFVERYLTEGNIAEWEPQLRRWDRHVSVWLDRAESQRVLVVKYEEMRMARFETLKRVQQFLEWPTDAAVELAAGRGEFESMQASERRHGAESFAGVKTASGAQFFRSGTAAGWVDELPHESVVLIEQAFGPVMQRCGYDLGT